MSNGPEASPERNEESGADRLARYILSSESIPYLIFGPFGFVTRLLGYLLRDVQRVDEETPKDLDERLLRLPQHGDAHQLLRRLEQVRTDVIHAFNTLEGLPKRREPFGVRLQRLYKEGRIPEVTYRQILAASRYRNRAVYDGYRLRPEERAEADQALDDVSKWAREVGFVY